MKTRVPVLIVVVVLLLAIWAMKRFYADASADDLLWILGPTASLVHVVTGVSFVLAPGEGYLSHDRLFLIEKSCAGINFMIAAFGMVTLALFHRVRSAASAARVLAVSLLTSYAAAVLVNASRIAIAMWIAGHTTAVGSLSPAEVHRIEGIVVYFSGLALLYELVRRFDRSPSAIASTFRRTAAPLGWYYAVTLGLPLANGAAHAGAVFVQHLLVVLVLPPLLIVVACAATDILRWVWTFIQGISRFAILQKLLNHPTTPSSARI